MSSGSVTGTSASCSPAPYGQACVGCSRAKCKCFYRSDGSSCERCHRLGKTCEPALAFRKRKARTPPPPTTQPPPPVNSRLEEKLDDLVSLLRSQAAERQGQPQIQPQQHTPQSTSEGTSGGYGESVSMSVHENPDVALDTAASVVHLLRPTTPPMSPSPIYDDISIHRLQESVAEEQLESFRRSFLSMFPFVHIPATKSAAELRREKPFLWLVIMALTPKIVSQQFVMESTIWHIISRRIVAQHFVNLDLLLGVICFASWSHYFKKDKPFMSMLSQIAVSLALELGIHRNPPTTPLRRSRLPKQPPERQPRTMEERRTMLAVFHLSSATWSTYRMTEPLRWTSYLEECLYIFSEGRETHLDILLTALIKCQIITNHLSCASPNEAIGVESPKAPSVALTTALLRQLNIIRQSLPVDIASNRTVQFYLLHAELRIRESTLGRSRSPDQTGLSQFQRVQDLESVLTTIERWLVVFSEMPLCDWVGFTVDVFTQFMQFLVVNFKLTILDEPGWDVQEVRRRADVFENLDRTCKNVERVPVMLGMVDTDGPRCGLFFKITAILRDVKALFLAEMPPPAAFPTPKTGADTNTNDFNDSAGGAELMDFSFSDEFLMGMLQDDILNPAWDFRADSSYMPFPT